MSTEHKLSFESFNTVILQSAVVTPITPKTIMYVISKTPQSISIVRVNTRYTSPSRNRIVFALRLVT